MSVAELKHAYNESDESLVERWLQDVYFQYFSGMEYFELRFPCDAPQIGRLKADHRMSRCWLKGAIGDAITAVLSAAGYNLRWRLRAVAASTIKAFLFRPGFVVEDDSSAVPTALSQHSHAVTFALDPTLSKPR